MLDGVISIGTLALYPSPQIVCSTCLGRKPQPGVRPLDCGDSRLGWKRRPLKMWGVLPEASVLSHKEMGPPCHRPPSPAGSPALPSAILSALLIVPAAEDGTLVGVPATGALGVHSLYFPHVPGAAAAAETFLLLWAAQPSASTSGSLCPQPPGGSSPGPQLLSSVTLPAAPSLSLRTACSLAAKGRVLSPASSTRLGGMRSKGCAQ